MALADLEGVAAAMVAADKGILAADESSGTIKKRFDKIGLDSTEEHRRTYREMLFTTAGVAQWISGVICFQRAIFVVGCGIRCPACQAWLNWYV